jgi:hypothetical protein
MHGTHVILIRNLSTSRFKRINENSNISIWTTAGKNISGRVKLIKADTIFFIDTIVRVANIDRIFFKSPAPFPNHMPDNERTVAYVAGWHNWQIICPPDSVYRNSWSYQSYMHNLIRQEKSEQLAPLNPLVYRNFLKVNIAKLFHLELALSYERYISKRFTWETELSGILGINGADAYYFIDYPLYNYNGISITTYPKFYVISPRTYLSPVFMYRYLWFKGVRTDWPDKDTEGNGELQDQYRHDLALSLRIGFMRRYGKFVIDFYAGGGIKYIIIHQLVYSTYEDHDDDEMYWNHPDHSPDTYNKGLFGPVINLGIKIGGAF